MQQVNFPGLGFRYGPGAELGNGSGSGPHLFGGGNSGAGPFWGSLISKLSCNKRHIIHSLVE